MEAPTFTSIIEAEKYLEAEAKRRNLKFYHIWGGVKKQVDVLILTETHEDGEPIKDILVIEC